MPAITFDKDFLVAVHSAIPGAQLKDIAEAAGIKPNNFNRSLRNHRKEGLIDADALKLTPEGVRLAGVAPSTSAPPTDAQSPEASASGATSVPLNLIVPGLLNPRKTFDDQKIAELAASLHQKGQLQNLVIRPIPDAADSEAPYEIVAGERRWRAFNKLAKDGAIGQDHPIKVEVRNLSDIEVLEIAVTENSQREDVHPLEEAEAIAALQEARLAEGNKQDARAVCREIAEKVGRTERWAQIRVNMVKRLSPNAVKAFRAGTFTSVKWADELGRWPHELQDRAVEKMTEERGYYRISTEAELKEWFRGQGHPVGKQPFQVQEYLDAGGEVSEPDEDGNRFFVNSGLAEDLAKNVAENALKEATEKNGYSVEPEIIPYFNEWNFPSPNDLSPKPPESLYMAVAEIDEKTLNADLIHPVVKRRAYEDWQEGKAKAASQDGDTPAVKPLAKGIWKRGAIARTHAVREAIGQNHHIAMALTIVALMSQGGWGRQTMIRIRLDDPSGDPRDIECENWAAALVLEKKIPGFDKDGSINDRGKVLETLFKDEELTDELFANLIADLTIDCHYDAHPGAMDEARALAEAGYVEDPGGDVVDAAWAKNFTKAQQAHLVDAYKLHLDTDQIAALKKSEADEAIAEALSADHKPIEARFVSEDKARALEAKLLRGEKV